MSGNEFRSYNGAWNDEKERKINEQLYRICSDDEEMTQAFVDYFKGAFYPEGGPAGGEADEVRHAFGSLLEAKANPRAARARLWRAVNAMPRIIAQRHRDYALEVARRTKDWHNKPFLRLYALELGIAFDQREDDDIEAMV